MPLNAAALAVDLENRMVQAYPGDVGELARPEIKAFAELFAGAFVDHLTAFGLVVVDVKGACPTGAVLGTGTGSIK